MLYYTGFGLNMVCFVLYCSLIISTVAARRIVDLTHTLDENAPKWPVGSTVDTDTPAFNYFKAKELFADYINDDLWVAFRAVEFYEHLGTHIDAPLHFGKGRQSLEAIPPQKLIGPGVVIDVRDKVKDNPNYAVTVEDIKVHEIQYGNIPPNAIVHMNSGWGIKFPNPLLVFGPENGNTSDPNTFNFPGWSPEACEYLLQKRQINVLGVDTPSTDPAQPVQYPCHIYLQNNEVPLLEYVANLDSVPVRNTTMVLGAMKVRGGTGGPTRIFALIDEDEDDVSGATGSTTLTAVLITCLYMLLK